MEKRKGEVQDLVHKLEEGQITRDEVISELEARRLTEKAVLKGVAWGYLLWAIPCFLPAIAKTSGLGILDPVAQLPVIELPTAVVRLAIILFVAAVPLTAVQMYWNVRRGGCRSEDETVILLRTGPYRIVRHPSHVAWAVFFVTLPIILSRFIPFTILSIVGMVAVVAFHWYASVMEEKKLDLRKWGDEYAQYMKEVPRWNVLRGLWNLWAKR